MRTPVPPLRTSDVPPPPPPPPPLPRWGVSNETDAVIAGGAILAAGATGTTGARSWGALYCASWTTIAAGGAGRANRDQEKLIAVDCEAGRDLATSAYRVARLPGPPGKTSHQRGDVRTFSARSPGPTAGRQDLDGHDPRSRRNVGMLARAAEDL